MDIDTRLQRILEALNWTEEIVLSKVNDKKKSVVVESVETEPHYESLWSESLSSQTSVTLTRDELRNLLNKPNAEIPQKFSDLQLNFNREEKLKIYEHVVKSCPAQSAFTNALCEHEQLFGEIVAKQKREKKRRHKYRTIKPTYIEEVRNVVQMQMSALQQYLKPKLEADRKHSSRTRSRRRYDSHRSRHRK